MHYFGAHVSIGGGLFRAPENARAIGATAFAMFTKNQRQWKASPLKEEEIADFAKAMQECGYTKDRVLPHDGYLINLGNPDEAKRENALSSFIGEMERCAALGLDKLNFHPGAHLKLLPVDADLRLIASCLDRAVEQVPGVMPVIETTAGQGSNVGDRFEEIRDLIGYSAHPDSLGVCIDTCHVFAAGYDLRSLDAWNKTFEDFGKIIGFGKLKGMHLNDAKSAFGSHVDRHAPLGEGSIGKECFSRIAKDPRFENIPLILETPVEEKWPEEIAWLKKEAE